MKLKIRNLAIIPATLTIATLLQSCGDSSESKDLTNEPIVAEEQKPKSEKVSLFKVGDELFSIPSPVQTSVMLKKSGATFNKAMLNDPKKASGYSTKFQRAVNLGVFGADLGYVTIYDQTQDAISYFNSTKKIADDLGVADAFNPELLKRFEANMGNQDSLLSIVSDAYRSSDEFLKANEREDVGALVLCGGWVEAMYFTTTIAAKSPSEDISKRIAEQKGSLENLIKLTQKYADNEKTADLVEELIDLYYLFDEIKITYNWVEPTTDEKTKTTTINSTLEVEASQEQLNAIADKVSEIRTHIIE